MKYRVCCAAVEVTMKSEDLATMPTSADGFLKLDRELVERHWDAIPAEDRNRIFTDGGITRKGDFTFEDFFDTFELACQIIVDQEEDWEDFVPFVQRVRKVLCL